MKSVVREQHVSHAVFFQVINGCVKKYGKDLPRSERTCEYVGVAKIDKAFNKKFVTQMDKLINEQHHDMWWENVLYSLTEKEDIHTLDVRGIFWSEIDYFDDYERILDYLDGKFEGQEV